RADEHTFVHPNRGRAGAKLRMPRSFKARRLFGCRYGLARHGVRFCSDCEAAWDPMVENARGLGGGSIREAPRKRLFGRRAVSELRGDGTPHTLDWRLCAMHAHGTHIGRPPT